MAYQTFRQEYLQMPVVTRAYTTACCITTLAVQLDLVSPFQLYFNPILILKQYQLWRLVTTFLFFGTVGFNFFFNMIFTYRYCRMLEEGSFRGRTADFVMMFLFGGICMIEQHNFNRYKKIGQNRTSLQTCTKTLRATGYSPSEIGQALNEEYFLTCIKIFAFFVNLLFLGQAFTIMLVYVWSRRNPFVQMNFFGLINFQAPYLPWVLLGFSVLLGNAIWVDLMGMAVGHIYYFIEDVFPVQRGGFKLLTTPQILKTLFDGHPNDPDYTQLPEERPGGFDWGGDQPQ